MPKSRNPYQRNEGFSLRFLKARTALEKYGRDFLARPYCRSFDNCFEMYDGDAVVWALIDRAIRNTAAGNASLEHGIRRLGPLVWPDWFRVYQEGSHQVQHCLPLSEPDTQVGAIG